jgi:hypothetical protein
MELGDCDALRKGCMFGIGGSEADLTKAML